MSTIQNKKKKQEKRIIKCQTWVSKKPEIRS